MAKLLEQPELSTLMENVVNFTEFSFALYNLSLQHQSLKVGEEGHFMQDDVIQIHKNIEKINKNKTVIYRQKG